MSNLIKLRRYDTSQPWGFRMNGGVELGQPLYIQKVTYNSVGHKAGLRPGDGILQIGMVATQNMTHDQAKMEIIRAGNEVDFIVQRNVVPVGLPSEGIVPLTPRAEGMTGPGVQAGAEEHNPNMQSRSFLMLQQQLYR